MSIPIGWKFSPDKFETITILHSLILGQSLPGIQVYQGYDVFGNLTPSELFNATFDYNNNGNDREGRYFYTPMKRLAKNGKNFKRTVEKINNSTGKLECIGTWKGGTAAEPIFYPNTDSLVGESRSFTFIEPSSDKWLMQLFCLAGDAVQDIQPDSDVFAICRIYKKSTKKPDVSLTASPNYFQPQPQAVAVNPMTSLHDYQSQQQTVTVNPMIPPNYCQPQPQTVTVNSMAESDINNSNLYSQLDHYKEMENIEAIVDNISFSGLNEDLGSELPNEEFDWIDKLNIPETSYFV